MRHGDETYSSLQSMTLRRNLARVGRDNLLVYTQAIATFSKLRLGKRQENQTRLTTV